MSCKGCGRDFAIEDETHDHCPDCVSDQAAGAFEVAIESMTPDEAEEFVKQRIAYRKKGGQ